MFHSGKSMGRQFAHANAHLSNQFRVFGVSGKDVGVISKGAFMTEHSTDVNVQFINAVWY